MDWSSMRPPDTSFHMSFHLISQHHSPIFPFLKNTAHTAVDSHRGKYQWRYWLGLIENSCSVASSPSGRFLTWWLLSTCSGTGGSDGGKAEDPGTFTADTGTSEAEGSGTSLAGDGSGVSTGSGGENPSFWSPSVGEILGSVFSGFQRPLTLQWTYHPLK